MIAEKPPGSDFIRVYDDGGSYAQGSPIRFVVGLKEYPNVYRGRAFLEAGMGRMDGEIWRAIDLWLGIHGFKEAEWEVVDQTEAGARPRRVYRKVRTANLLSDELVS